MAVSASQFWILLALVATACAAAASAPSSESQHGPPADDPSNPLRYITSNTLSTVVRILAVAFIHTWLAVKTKTKYMLVVLVAEYCYAIGIAARYGLHYSPDNLGIYIIMFLFTTLSPCGIIAGEYVLLGRLAQWLEGGQHLLLRPQRVTLIFVISDVVTFLIQSLGGSLAVSARTNATQAANGSHIILTGLILQLASFACFVILFLHFLYRMRTYEPATWNRDKVAGSRWFQDWRAFAVAMCVSCVGVLVRSVYRTLEFAQGFDSHLSTTEVYFWVLDFVPLWIALLIYIPFWPGWFINRVRGPPAQIPAGSRNLGAYKRTNEDIPLQDVTNKIQPPFVE